MAATACGQTVEGSPGRPVTDGQSERVTVDSVCCVWGQRMAGRKKTEKNLKFLLCYIRHMETQQWMEAHTETHTQYNTLLSQQDKQHSKTAPA